MAIDGGFGWAFFSVDSFVTSDPIFPNLEALPGYPQSGFYRANGGAVNRTGTAVLLNGVTIDDGINPPRHGIRKFTLIGSDAVQRLYDIHNLPPGFQITGIQQLLTAWPSSPQPTSIPPYYGTIFGSYLGRWNGEPPVIGNPGDPGFWEDLSFTTSFGINGAGGTFDPANDTLNFLVGSITAPFFQPIPIDPIDAVPPAGLSITRTSTPLNVLGDPILTPDDTPYSVVAFSWVSDSDNCAGLGPVTGLTITDPVTGAISWTLPVGADGSLVRVVSLTDDTEEYVAGPTNAYVPTLSGDLTITVYAIKNTPVICISTGESVSVSVTAPFVFTMGEDGISTGIFLGGTSPLQFIGNPSGIYTVVPGKTYDTLYERIPTVTSQDVKIPDPTIVTAYVGE